MNICSTSSVQYNLTGVDLNLLFFFVPAFIISLIALIITKSVISKGYKKNARSKMTGADAANLILEHKKCRTIEVKRTNKRQHARYDITTRTVDLSSQTYYGSSMTSLAMASQEACHATQNFKSLLIPLVRYIINPIIQITAIFALPVIIVGLIIQMGSLVNIGFILFSVAVALSLLVIPYELSTVGTVYDILRMSKSLIPPELKLVKRIVTISSLTYMASTFTALWMIIKKITWALGKGAD